jgi:hypothetical protein
MDIVKLDDLGRGDVRMVEKLLSPRNQEVLQPRPPLDFTRQTMYRSLRQCRALGKVIDALESRSLVANQHARAVPQFHQAGMELKRGSRGAAGNVRSADVDDSHGAAPAPVPIGRWSTA